MNKEYSAYSLTLNIGMGNLILSGLVQDNFDHKLPQVKAKSMIIRNPLTQLAQITQAFVTSSDKRACEYSQKQTQLRSSFMAKALGQFSVRQALKEIPPLRQNERRALIATNEMLLSNIDELNALPFTHLYLLAGDVELKPSAIQVVKSSKGRIRPIVQTKQGQRVLDNLGVYSLLCAPVIASALPVYPGPLPKVNLIKEAGAGMDKQLKNTYQQLLKDPQIPTHIMDSHARISKFQNGKQIETIQSRNLLEHYSYLSQVFINSLAMYPSEMVIVAAALGIDQILLGSSRGLQEIISRIWLQSMYETTVVSSSPQITQLYARRDTSQQIADSLGHAPIANVVYCDMNR